MATLSSAQTEDRRRFSSRGRLHLARLRFRHLYLSFSVRIGGNSWEGEVDYEIRVYEEGGRLLERASDVEISKAMEGISGQESFKTMKEVITHG